ncbi:Uncharacterised protein [Citrobacter freundii]|nr:Uncharacterised protein [Citrobacter freundii]
MDKNIINSEFTLEEQLIIIVDKYISKRYHPGDKNFSYQPLFNFCRIPFKIFLP